MEKVTEQVVRKSFSRPPACIKVKIDDLKIILGEYFKRERGTILTAIIYLDIFKTSYKDYQIGRSDIESLIIELKQLIK